MMHVAPASSPFTWHAVAAHTDNHHAPGMQSLHTQTTTTRLACSHFTYRQPPRTWHAVTAHTDNPHAPGMQLLHIQTTTTRLTCSRSTYSRCTYRQPPHTWHAVAADRGADSKLALLALAACTAALREGNVGRLAVLARLCAWDVVVHAGCAWETLCSSGTTEHCTHADAPVLEKYPCLVQSVHAVAPLAGEYVSMSQL